MIKFKRLFRLLTYLLLSCVILVLSSAWIEKKLFLALSHYDNFSVKWYAWGDNIFKGKGYSIKALENALSLFSAVGEDEDVTHVLWETEKQQIKSALAEKKYRQARRWLSRSEGLGKSHKESLRLFHRYEKKEFNLIKDTYIHAELFWARKSNKIPIIKGYSENWQLTFLGDWKRRNKRKSIKNSDNKVYLYLKLSNRLINTTIVCDVQIKAEEKSRISNQVGKSIGLISSIIVNPLTGYLTSDIANQAFDYFGDKSANKKWRDKSTSSVNNIRIAPNKTIRYNGAVRLNSPEFTKTPAIASVGCIPK